MKLTFAIIATLLFLLLWHLAWRRRPRVAFGMFIGLAGACALVAYVSMHGMRQIPIWLPALPVALVALTLFGFGILAWRWGRDR